VGRLVEGGAWKKQQFVEPILLPFFGFIGVYWLGHYWVKKKLQGVAMAFCFWPFIGNGEFVALISRIHCNSRALTNSSMFFKRVLVLAFVWAAGPVIRRKTNYHQKKQPEL